MPFKKKRRITRRCRECGRMVRVHVTLSKKNAFLVLHGDGYDACGGSLADVEIKR